MKKKTVVVVLSVVLLLLLTSLGYGGAHKPFKKRDHPWQDIWPSAPNDSTSNVYAAGADNSGNIFTVVPVRCGNISLLFVRLKSQSAPDRNGRTF